MGGRLKGKVSQGPERLIKDEPPLPPFPRHGKKKRTYDKRMRERRGLKREGI